MLLIPSYQYTLREVHGFVQQVLQTHALAVSVGVSQTDYAGSEESY